MQLDHTGILRDLPLVLSEVFADCLDLKRGAFSLSWGRICMAGWKASHAGSAFHRTILVIMADAFKMSKICHSSFFL
jgi:hypothetical protein